MCFDLGGVEQRYIREHLRVADRHRPFAEPGVRIVNSVSALDQNTEDVFDELEFFVGTRRRNTEIKCFRSCAACGTVSHTRRT